MNLYRNTYSPVDIYFYQRKYEYTIASFFFCYKDTDPYSCEYSEALSENQPIICLALDCRIKIHTSSIYILSCNYIGRSQDFEIMGLTPRVVNPTRKVFEFLPPTLLLRCIVYKYTISYIVELFLYFFY